MKWLISENAQKIDFRGSEAEILPNSTSGPFFGLNHLK
jgi:hypothetical protein